METPEVQNMIFNRIPHHENPTNTMRTPWVMDTIIIEDEGRQVGSIKMAYVPFERIQEFKEEPLLVVAMLGNEDRLYKTDWRFLDSLSQQERNRGQNWRGHLIPNHEEQAFFVMKALRKSNQTYEDLVQEKHRFEQMSNDDYQQYVKENKEKLWKWVVKKYGKTMHFHFARPDIQYIVLEPEYRGLGLGQKLYELGSKWMNEKNMVLHSSNQSIQSVKAQNAWKSLCQKGKAELVAGTEENPRYCYTEGVPPHLFSDKILVKEPAAPKKTVRKSPSPLKALQKAPKIY